jgi:hypothetical protein
VVRNRFFGLVAVNTCRLRGLLGRTVGEVFSCFGASLLRSQIRKTIAPTGKR